MSHDTSNDSATFTLLDYLGLGFILFPPEEIGRHLFVGDDIPLRGYICAAAYVAVGAIVLRIAKWVKATPTGVSSRFRAQLFALSSHIVTYLVVGAILVFGIPLTIAMISGIGIAPAIHISDGRLVSQSPIGSPVKTASRSLSPDEAQRKIKVIDQFIDLIGPLMEPTINEGLRLQTGGWNAFKDEKNNLHYIEDLDAYIAVTKGNEEKIISLQGQHPEYEDVIEAVSNGYPLYGAAMNFRQGYQLLTSYLSKDIDSNNFNFLLKPYSEPFHSSIINFRDWRAKTHSSLVELRKGAFH